MNLERLCEILEAKALSCGGHLNREIKMVCGSDLMSDVLAYIKADALLLTGLTNIQVVRTAEMAEVAAVCFVRGKQPHDETIKLAEEKKLPLLTTNLTMYESCGRLYREGLQSCDESK
jgi:predicted transcriptional regulator